MQPKQDLVRNFCPKCLIIVENSLDGLPKFFCQKCKSEDLIPIPFGVSMKQEMSIEEAKTIFPETYSQPDVEIPSYIDPKKVVDAAPKPTSKLELDQNAVDKLINEEFGFLTGLAGTGKSTLINEVNRLYPDLLEICATTGIAAVNLNAKTLHSTLKFFNTQSLENAWREGMLHYQLRMVRSRKKKLLVDEISMFGAEPFNLLVNAIDDINSDDTGKKLGLWITGDLMQLPPIKEDYIFKSDYWERFEKNTVRLTKVWRQDNTNFLTGINLIRANKGAEAVKMLQGCGVNFTSTVNDNFEGTTLIPKNDGVDIYNEKRLRQINFPLIRVCTLNKGLQHKEWQRLIPYELRLKVGALVMILSNDVPEFNYVNGDLGIIEKYDVASEKFHIKLMRTGNIVTINRITRQNLVDKEPEQPYGNFVPYSDFKTGQWIIGTIDYFPLRLAYASTIHKCLHEDTIVIEQFRGKIPIKYILVGDSIFNGIIFVKVKSIVKTKRRGLQITTDKYKTICSFDHRFPIESKAGLINISAKDFKIGDYLLNGNRTISDHTTQILKLEDLCLTLPMIDLEIEDVESKLSHLFWADGLLTHNSQGLSLDAVQIDTRPQFFGFDSMAYVAISRARTPQGLTLVGDPNSIARKIKMNREVLKYV